MAARTSIEGGEGHVWRYLRIGPIPDHCAGEGRVMAGGFMLGLTLYVAGAILLGKMIKMADDGFDEDGLT